ncbi:MAG TPA: serine/threonine protein kinase, partial [Enhygromyxa sp.]|nr:serine/threonine protein kinase [Enhygromyxa sp.]
MRSSASPMVSSKDPHDDEFVVPIRDESDLGHARMFAREICKLVELHGYQAQKVVTAVSELARNIIRYSHGGRLRFR